MIKFIHKKHINKSETKGKIIIYYSALDICLGIVLLALTVFFMQDYLSHSLSGQQKNCFSAPKSMLDLPQNPSPIHRN